MATGLALPETSLILDNDVFSHWRNAHDYAKSEIGNYIRRLKRPPALASITIFEALYGIENSRVKEKLSDQQAAQYRARVIELSEACIVLPFDQVAASIAAHIFPRLSRSDQSKHWKDIFAAATALAHGHGIATGNKRDFELIGEDLPVAHPFLRIAIWRP
jgi:predicted nucleic acid-binding protein